MSHIGRELYADRPHRAQSVVNASLLESAFQFHGQAVSLSGGFQTSACCHLSLHHSCFSQFGKWQGTFLNPGGKLFVGVIDTSVLDKLQPCF